MGGVSVPMATPSVSSSAAHLSTTHIDYSKYRALRKGAKAYGCVAKYE